MDQRRGSDPPVWERPIGEQMALLRHDLGVHDVEIGIVHKQADDVRDRLIKLERLVFAIIGDPDIKSDTGQLGRLDASVRYLKYQQWVIFVTLLTGIATTVFRGFH